MAFEFTNEYLVTKWKYIYEVKQMNTDCFLICDLSMSAKTCFKNKQTLVVLEKKV